MLVFEHLKLIFAQANSVAEVLRQTLSESMERYSATVPALKS